MTGINDSINREDIMDELNRVLSSKYFANSPMKKKFLTLVCDFHLRGHGEDLNELLIGHEVYGRDESYNPATDPIVRVGAYSIREKLEIYYQKEGAHDQIRIEMPIGSYDPRFVRPVSNSNNIDESTPVSVQEAKLSPQQIRGIISRHLLKVVFLLVSILTIYLIYSNYDLRKQLGSERSISNLALYQPLWGPFINTDKQPLVVLSNPPVFRFINPSDPDVIVNNSIPVSKAESENIFNELPNKNIIQIIDNPRLTLTTDIYTGMGEAIGAQKLTDLFNRLKKSISVKQSRIISADDLKESNVIILGSAWVNDWTAKLPIREDFVFSDKATIVNRNPEPGEAKEYIGVFNNRSGQLTQDYAVFTVGPNISSRFTVMILSGLHSEGTAAAAEYVTSNYYLNQLNEELRPIRQDSDYFQGLLKVGVDNGIPTTISLVTIHKLKRIN